MIRTSLPVFGSAKRIEISASCHCCTVASAASETTSCAFSGSSMMIRCACRPCPWPATPVANRSPPAVFAYDRFKSWSRFITTFGQRCWYQGERRISRDCVANRVAKSPS